LFRLFSIAVIQFFPFMYKCDYSQWLLDLIYRGVFFWLEEMLENKATDLYTQSFFIKINYIILEVAIVYFMSHSH